MAWQSPSIHFVIWSARLRRKLTVVLTTNITPDIFTYFVYARLYFIPTAWKYRVFTIHVIYVIYVLRFMLSVRINVTHKQTRKLRKAMKWRVVRVDVVYTLCSDATHIVYAKTWWMALGFANLMAKAFRLMFPLTRVFIVLAGSPTSRR